MASRPAHCHKHGKNRSNVTLIVQQHQLFELMSLALGHCYWNRIHVLLYVISMDHFSMRVTLMPTVCLGYFFTIEFFLPFCSWDLVALLITVSTGRSCYIFHKNTMVLLMIQCIVPVLMSFNMDLKGTRMPYGESVIDRYFCAFSWRTGFYFPQ